MARTGRPKAELILPDAERAAREGWVRRRSTPQAWAPRRGRWTGVDAGKGHHWAAVADETGATLWAKQVDNDESAILTAPGEILDLADEVH